jgi:hypothetical protein
MLKPGTAAPDPGLNSLGTRGEWDDPGWNADRSRVVRNIFDNDCVCGDYGVLADGHARNDHAIGAKPRSISDLNRRDPINALVKDREGRVVCPMLVVEDADVPGDQYGSTERDPCYSGEVKAGCDSAAVAN